MNILRKNRKSNKKTKLQIFILLVFTLVMTTFAWFTYAKILLPALNVHIASWNMEYYVGAEKKTNPIGIEFRDLFPTMPEQSVTVNIRNNGETLVDINHNVKSVKIAGVSYELVKPSESPVLPGEEKIFLREPVLTTNETTGEKIYKTSIINDTTRFPFTIDMEYSAQVKSATKDASGRKTPGTGYMKITVNWLGDNDVLDSDWGYKVGEYLANNPTATSAMSIVFSIDSYQADGEIY